MTEALSSTSKEILYSVQVLRGVGALLVVLRHTAKILSGDDPTAFAHGQFGVDIFFVISGLVIFLTGREMDAGKFLSRRLLRVVPIYWLVLAVTILGDVVRQRLAPGIVSNSIYSFLFIPSLNPEGEVFPPNVVGWSLNFEMYFYLICTFCILVLGKGRLLQGASIIIISSVLLGFAVSDVLPPQDFPAVVFLLPITLEFLAGMWLAQLILSKRLSSPVVASFLFVSAIIWLIVAPTALPYTEWRALAWGVPAVAIVWAAVSTEHVIDYKRFRPALLLGDASYALYLVHPIALAVLLLVFNKIGFDGPWWLLFGLMFGCSVVAGIVAHLVLELPLTRLVGHLTGIRRTRSGNVRLPVSSVSEAAAAAEAR